MNNEYKIPSTEITSLCFLNCSLKLWAARNQSLLLCTDQKRRKGIQLIRAAVHLEEVLLKGTYKATLPPIPFHF